MKIFGWTTGATGLDRIRVEMPLEELGGLGHVTGTSTTFLREWGDADTVVGCRVANSDPSRLWTHACGMYDGPFMVFETDDDNLNLTKWNNLRPSPKEESPLEFWANPERRFLYMSNMRISHRIVTSTNYLANLLQDQTGHPDVVVARNGVPAWTLDLPQPNAEYNGGPVVVGWAGGSSHWGDWEWTSGGIRRGIALSPNTTLYFVGQDFRRLVKLPANRMSHRTWFKNVDEFWAHGHDGVHIGLAPLRPEAFNKSKSEIKLIEYGARGIPVIAQDYGPYSSFVEDGVTGFLVKTNKQWTEAIVELASDHDLRLSMGKAAQNKIREGHTIDKLIHQYLEAYTP